ncbi:hypothetical protein HMPREF9306_00880 [Propionimicrobium lymphophilum ACS-093-V-SCH5]|uniref:Xylulokinase n=2 Tax=Propionibacteriaceae TaxID=31957 RepID=S2W2H2_9ACTN|nr:hypothetical protein HMPREF9306_00880 [Propionimicrobium lymphophilum ACS-093-V-SCH5]ETJ97906.1 carbohydrate kinase, FGGY family protein [Propionimicrobium sp. BV2F7]
MEKFIIGIDIGTGSTKGILADCAGNVLHTTIVKHKTSFPRPGWAEHDADEVWWADVVAVCRELTTRAKGSVAGICISGIGPVFLAANDRGMPLRQAILYGVDTRASEEINELNERYGYDEIYNRCCNNMTSQSVGPKILWVKKNEPEVWKRTSRFLMAHTYCVFHLTGQYVLDHLSASMCEPLYSPITNDWVDEWVEDICGDLPMPKLMWSNEIAGYVTDNAARITGLAPGTPVAVGSIDAFVEGLSVGVRNPGQVMIMYGSTMVGIQISDKPLKAENLWSCSGLFKDTYLLAGGMSTSGSITTWICDLTGNSYDDLTKAAEQSGPGARGLLLLPYFSGERSPIADEKARGVLAGLNLTHTKGDIYRAALESITYGSRHILSTMAEAGGKQTEYWAVGGGTKGGLLPQIMSDSLHVEQFIPKITTGACYGDALLAAMAAGLVETDTSWNEAIMTVSPNSDVAKQYDEMYENYLKLYPSTLDVVHELAVAQDAEAGA